MTNISDIEKALAPLGLNEKDIMVYIYLLERGTAVGGSKIAAGLRIHRQYVHSSVKKLLELQLIEQPIKGTRPKFQAFPPRYLTQLARKRLEETEVVAHELDAISNMGADQEFEVYRGTQQVINFEGALVNGLEENQTQYIIGGGSESFRNFFGKHYVEFSNIARSKKLKTFYVGSKDEIETLEKAKDIMKDFEYTIVDGMPKTKVQTVIRLDSITLYSFGTPTLVYVLKSKSVYEDYKNFFTMLWEQGGASSSSLKFLEV